MPKLRDVLTRAGFNDARTYIQSGNIVLASSESPERIAEELNGLIYRRDRPEVYSWHPAGVGRSPLWERLAGIAIGVVATSRNWATVTTLLAMADGTIPR